MYEYMQPLLSRLLSKVITRSVGYSIILHLVLGSFVLWYLHNKQFDMPVNNEPTLMARLIPQTSQSAKTMPAATQEEKSRSTKKAPNSPPAANPIPQTAPKTAATPPLPPLLTSNETTAEPSLNAPSPNIEPLLETKQTPTLQQNKQAGVSSSNISDKKATTDASTAPTAPQFDANYLSNPAPTYPLLSRKQGESGKVVLRVFVTPEGTANQVEIYRSSQFSRLDDAAVKTVWKWRFVPARQGEKAIGAWVLVPIVFKLDSSTH